LVREVEGLSLGLVGLDERIRAQARELRASVARSLHELADTVAPLGAYDA
jgi:hypothetical protein